MSIPSLTNTHLQIQHCFFPLRAPDCQYLLRNGGIWLRGTQKVGCRISSSETLICLFLENYGAVVPSIVDLMELSYC